MNAKTLKALKGSIAKWEAIVAEETIDEGHRNCPLCEMFFFPGCRDCPVKERTGMSSCHGTPYQEKWVPNGGEGYGADTPTRKEAALAELAFLRSLLPKRKRK